MAAEKLTKKRLIQNYYHADYFSQRIRLAISIVISAVKFLIVLRREKEPQICGSLFLD